MYCIWWLMNHVTDILIMLVTISGNILKAFLSSISCVRSTSPFSIQTNKQTKTSWTQSIKLHFKWFCHCVSVVYLKATEGGRCGSVIHLRPSTLAGERGSFIFWEPKRRNLWHLFLRTAHLASFSFSRVRSAKCMVPTQSSGWGMPSQDEAITDQ